MSALFDVISDFPGDGAREESIAKKPVDDAVNLLSQQIWCWGRDILRPEGNWLLEIGFKKQQPPGWRKECSSLYTLKLSDQRCIILRGFGIFYGFPSHGGIFLPRFEFKPLFLPLGRLHQPPWSDEDLPELNPPEPSQRNVCVSLTLDLIDWIRAYEVRIFEELGIQYRRQTLRQWNNGKRVCTPPEDFASAWRELSFKLAANADDYLV
ncbi:hypothetical protein OAH34_01065 [bacterium]|nr:hypothetical protein [bacterium]